MVEFMEHEDWKDTLFLHYEADPNKLGKLLPKGLTVDTYNGKAYVGVVALSENGILATLLPQWLRRFLAMSHHAVNVRTYVRHDQGGPPGIYFFTLECSQLLPALGARLLFHLPYRLSWMRRRSYENRHSFYCQRLMCGRNAELKVEWEHDGTRSMPTDLSTFFVERYCLYNYVGKFLKLFMRIKSLLWRGSITHAAWPLMDARLIGHIHNTMLQAIPQLYESIVDNKPIVHYSPGVQNIQFYFEAL